MEGFRVLRALWRNGEVTSKKEGPADSQSRFKRRGRSNESDYREEERRGKRKRESSSGSDGEDEKVEKTGVSRGIRGAEGKAGSDARRKESDTSSLLASSLSSGASAPSAAAAAADRWSHEFCFSLSPVPIVLTHHLYECAMIKNSDVGNAAADFASAHTSKKPSFGNLHPPSVVDRSEIDREIEDARSGHVVRLFHAGAGKAQTILSLSLDVYVMYRRYALEVEYTGKMTGRFLGELTQKRRKEQKRLKKKRKRHKKDEGVARGSGGGNQQDIDRDLFMANLVRAFAKEIILNYTNVFIEEEEMFRRLARHLTKEKQKEQEQSEQENFKGKVREQTIVKLSSAERTKFLSLMTSVGGLRMKPDCSSAFFICVPQTGPFIEHLRNGRKEIIRALRRAPYNELLEHKLSRINIRKSDLSADFLTRDAIASGDVVSVSVYQYVPIHEPLVSGTSCIARTHSASALHSHVAAGRLLKLL